MIRESFGVRVVETDLFASASGSPSRLRADMTALPLKTSATPMVISSWTRRLSADWIVVAKKR